MKKGPALLTETRHGALPRLVRVLLITDALLLGAYLSVGLLVYCEVLGRRAEIFRLVNIEAEGNLPTWYSSIQLFLLSTLLGLHAWRISRERRDKLVWLPAMVFLLMSIDEIAMFHEWIGYRLDYFLPDGTRQNTPFDYTGIWGLAIGIPALVLLLLMWYRLRQFFFLTPATAGRLLIGSCFLIIGAAGFDFLANFSLRGPIVVHALEVLAEEGCELIGVTILCWGALDLLSVGNFRVEYDPLN